MQTEKEKKKEKQINYLISKRKIANFNFKIRCMVNSNFKIQIVILDLSRVLSIKPKADVGCGFGRSLVSTRRCLWVYLHLCGISLLRIPKPQPNNQQNKFSPGPNTDSEVRRYRNHSEGF